MEKGINRNDLIDVLSKIKPALSTQDFLPILSCFCFTEDSIYAYNDELAISFPNKNIPFKGAVKGDQLLKLLNSFTSDSIKMSVKDNSVRINSGKSNIKLPILNKDSFVWERPSKKGAFKIEVDEEFIEGLKMCLISIGQDVMHPEHMGIQISSIDDDLVMYSTDNYTLSMYTMEEYEEDNFEPVVLPETFCKQLIFLFEDMKNPYLFILDNYVYVLDESSKIIILTKLIYQGEGSSYSHIIKKYRKYLKDIFYSIKDSDFSDSLDRALIVNGTESTKVTNLIFEKGIVKLETKANNGHVRDTIKMGKKGVKDRKSIDINFPTNLAARASKVMTMISFNEEVMLFKYKESFIHIIALEN